MRAKNPEKAGKRSLVGLSGSASPGIKLDPFRVGSPSSPSTAKRLAKAPTYGPPATGSSGPIPAKMQRAPANRGGTSGGVGKAPPTKSMSATKPTKGSSTHWTLQPNGTWKPTPTVRGKLKPRGRSTLMKPKPIPRKR